LRPGGLQRRQLLAGLLASAALGPKAVSALSPGGLDHAPPPKPAPRSGQVIEAAGLRAEIDYAVFSADGTLLEARGADRPVAPASTLKALTALYALDRLGGSHGFKTRVLRQGDMLILAGGGDPVLDTDHLAELADLLVASGVSTPSRFAVWGGALPSVQEIAPEQAAHLAYNPAISGICLNFNRVHLGWRAGGDGIALQARARRHSPTAYTVRAEKVGQGPMFAWRADERSEIWSVNGAGMRRAGSRWLPVRRPELYAGDVFQTLCRARGLVLPTPEIVDALPADALELAQIDSPPLAAILRDMMEYSTNLTAEVLGLHASGAGDLRASAQAMQDWAHARGIDGLTLHDHSGISPLTRVTARSMAHIIADLGQSSGLRGMMRAVPVRAATDGGPAAELELLAKTGTLNFVSNLAGYGRLPGHEEVIFAIFISDMDRRAQTEGQELPAGVSTWTQRAKALQQNLIAGWISRYA